MPKLLRKKFSNSRDHSRVLPGLLFFHVTVKYIDRLSLTAELSQQKADDKLSQGERSDAQELRLTTELFFSFSNSQK